MRAKLTHTEACRLVEDSLKRAIDTLLYIRARLEKGICDKVKIPMVVEETDLLCNINWYGAWLNGAIAMFRRLHEDHYLDIVYPRDTKKYTKEERYVNKAELELFIKNSRNIEWFLVGRPNSVELHTKLERDDKGRVKGAKAFFVKKETTYKEI